jgi:hypothetical protein
MQQLAKLLLVITDDQGCDDPGQLSQRFRDQDFTLSPRSAGESNPAICFWN